MDDNVVPFKGPVAGLLALRDMPEEEPLQPWYCGFVEWRKKISIAPRTLSVCTGHPGSGKTSLMGNIWFNIASVHDARVVVATYETRPMNAYRKMLRQFWAGLPHYDMTDEQKLQADDFIHDHYRFLIHPQQRPTLEWIFDWALKGGNCPDILTIDPWNRIESQRAPDQTETEFIASCLRECLIFAQENNCHVQIVAHPAKRDIRYRHIVPTLEDISGSKNWDNMPDQGFAVFREKFFEKETGKRRWDAHFYHLKARFDELGHPCCMDVRLNPETWRFESVTDRG